MACTSHQDRLPSGAAQCAPHHQGRRESPDFLHYFNTNACILVFLPIVFEYDPKVDSILRVTKEDYENCNKAKPIEKYKEGMTKIELNHSRSFYFIGGSEGKYNERGQNS
ncbi:early nodulin-like protein 1 [Quercus suber]|uniref:Early nodulin-like protein 1 n=1 Tax=Quercus suber TaxID=58331 RepID=A0AAW0KXT2_QUESU